MRWEWLDEAITCATVVARWIIPIRSSTQVPARWRVHSPGILAASAPQQPAEPVGKAVLFRLWRGRGSGGWFVHVPDRCLR
jgi:hypothetical protein